MRDRVNERAGGEVALKHTRGTLQSLGEDVQHAVVVVRFNGGGELTSVVVAQIRPERAGAGLVVDVHHRAVAGQGVEKRKDGDGRSAFSFLLGRSGERLNADQGGAGLGVRESHF